MPDLTSPATRAGATHTPVVHGTNTQLTTATRALAARVVSDPVSAPLSPTRPPSRTDVVPDYQGALALADPSATDAARGAALPARTSPPTSRPCGKSCSWARVAPKLLAQDIVYEPNLRPLPSHVS